MKTVNFIFGMLSTIFGLGILCLGILTKVHATWIFGLILLIIGIIGLYFSEDELNSQTSGGAN
jgi:uncharacterized membrane protein HdeD (DUF308 family)